MTPNPCCEAVLNALHERRLDGGPIDWDGEIAEHPRCAEAIRSLRADIECVERLLPVVRPPAVGDGVNGFVLTRHLGGNLGQVFAAREVATGREVAVKFVGQQEEDRFDRLVELVGLRHERILPVEQAGRHAGRPYLVMPLVAGGDLAGSIARYSVDAANCPAGEVSERLRAVARLMAEAAEGATYLHNFGVIHRDLKPGNILIGPDGAVLCDFGLLRRVSEPLHRTELGQQVGAPAYMAPEQAEGRVVSTRADVWSLGAVLYELLVGHPPFCPLGTEYDDLMEAKLRHDSPPLPSVLNPGRLTDADLEWVCVQCLHRDPDRRPAAGDLARMLRSCLAGEPVRPTETWVEWITRVFPLPSTDRPPPRGEWHYPERWKWLLRVEACTSAVAHAGVFALSLLAFPGWVVWVWFLLADTLTGWVIWSPSRRRAVLTPMERAIAQWWAGADLGILAVFWAFCPVLDSADPVAVGRFYAAAAAIRAVIFWAEGATWWGRLHYSALAFFAAAAVIPFVTPFGPLVFAALYSANFVWLSVQRWTRSAPSAN